MPFLKHMMEQVQNRGERVLSAAPLVDELRVINDNKEYLARSLELSVDAIHVYDVTDPAVPKEDAVKINNTVPSRPEVSLI